jgi:hypothetical protein
MPNWVIIRNDSGEVIEGNSLVRVTGVDTDGNFIVGKPNRDGQTDLYISGPNSVPNGSYGQAHNEFPAIVKYDTANETNAAPADGEIWGAKSGSWKLTRKMPGFRIMGDGIQEKCIIARATTSLIAFVYVTSATASSGRYPATEKFFDPVAGTWADGDAVWYNDANGAVPTVNTYHQAMLVGYANGRKVYREAVQAVAGTVGLKGQANSLPTTPEGPRATANLIPFTPAIGSNFSITLVDDPGNDRLNWTLNNLGLFVVDPASAQVGPRRQLHFLPDAAGIVRIVVADDAGNDEVEVTVDLDPPGLPYAVLWTDSGGNVIAWTDDPEVVRLTARSEIVIGVANDTTGILKFKDEHSNRSFDIQADTQGSSQSWNLPQSLPTVRQFLQAYQVSGGDVQTKWVGLGLSTQSVAGLTVVASIDNWEQIRFNEDFFEVFGNDAGTPANSTYGIVSLKSSVPPNGTHDSECDITGTGWNDDNPSGDPFIGPLAAGTYLFTSSIIGAILLDATSDDGSQAEILARYDRRNGAGTSQQTYGDFLIVQATWNDTLATQWSGDQRAVDSGPMTAIITAAEGDKVYLQFKKIATDSGTSPALTAVINLAEILNGYGVGGVARTCWHRLN